MTKLLRLATLDWQRAFSPVTCSRGREYARAGHVRNVRPMDPQGLRWSADVDGTGTLPYHAEVQVIAPVGRAAPRLLSTCTCPVGSLCKHAAAVLFSVQMAQEGEPGAEALPIPTDRGADAAPAVPKLADWERWLDRLAPPPPPARPEASDVGLLVRVAAHGDPPQLLAAMVTFGRGKKEQLTDPQAIVDEDGHPSVTPAGGWREDDLTALMLLLERQTERVGALSYVVLQGRAQERAFEHLLSRFPVCLERGSQPLASGPARALVLRWEDLPDGRQRLVCGADDEAELRLVGIDGLWYLDEAGARIGRIEGSRDLLAVARTAPLLDPELVVEVRDRLRNASAPSPIPPPRERAPPRLLKATPQPVLSMRLLAPVPNIYGGRNQGEVVGTARIGFDYAGERLEFAGVDRERRLRQGELREIVRDRAAEQRFVERAREFGMVSPGSLPWPLSYSFSHLGADHLLLAPGSNRQPQPAESWTGALRLLEAEGWKLEYAADFPRPLREIDAGDWDAELSERSNAWFDLKLGIDIEGKRVDLLPILRQIIADPRFPMRMARNEAPNARWRIALDDERALLLPLSRLRTLLAPLLDWLQQDRPLRLHRSQADTLAALNATVHWRGDARLREKLVDLRTRATSIQAPEGFRATLRPYQCEGLAWLELLAQAGIGGVLADDMGLGKTVQVLAHVLMQKQNAEGAFRVLVVAPTSLMGNWRDEAARFAPDLKTLVLHGPDRGDRYDEIANHDLILTTYPLLPRDRERLLQHEFDLLVLDEAQAIKNSRSQAAQVVRELRATRRLAMTGTPLENHLGELWAQFDAVEPGLLGSERDFTRWYRTPIEKHGDRDRQQRLHQRIGSLLLRRRKDEVLRDLPPKTEIVRMLDLEGPQRELYETLRLAQHERVREAIAERGMAQSGIVVLDALLKLRQACCDPRLVKLPAARKVPGSAKLDALRELLRTLLAEGRRVLLFSQFTAMLDLIEPTLREDGVEFLRLDGDTPGRSRAGLVRRFQDGETALFLISLKAGGVGLNLTAADTVIHFDPWWNPAVERQATDRAHRIGQNKAVFVYKLICTGTVEEKIVAMQTRKADLAQAVLEGGRSTRLRFDEDDLSELFAPLE